jgi:hypothetical protein
MPSSMDTKRWLALQDIRLVVGVDLLKWPLELCEEARESYDQQKQFYDWLVFMTTFCEPHNLTNYPLSYRGAVQLNPYIMINKKKWEYLIEFN